MAWLPGKAQPTSENKAQPSVVCASVLSFTRSDFNISHGGTGTHNPGCSTSILPMEWLRQVGAHPSLKEHQPRESKITGVKPQSLRNQWKFSQRFQQSNHSYFTLFSVTNANILPVYQGCLLGAASPRAPSVLPCH